MGNMLDLLLMEVVKVMKFMSHGTLTSLPFNWTPNSGQFIDKESRGPLDAKSTTYIICNTVKKVESK